jgi:NAD-dependent SIR2 family protein deacetylase
LASQEDPSEAFDRNVYLLGAGFSAAAGAPLIHNFLDVASALWEDPDTPLTTLQRQDFETVFEFRREMAQAREKVRIDLDNVEHLFGLVEIAHRLSTASQSVRRAILTLIATTLELTTSKNAVSHISFNSRKDASSYLTSLPVYRRDPMNSPPTYSADVYSHFAALVGGLLDPPDTRKKHHDTIITFNYDLVIDRALRAMGLRVSYHLPESEQLSTETSVSVLKLHGSVNWAACELCGGAQVTPIDQPVISTKVSSKCSKCDQILRPLLIPPSWNKAGSDMFGADAVTTLWSEAENALATATRICVIGYSVPETDAFFRYLLTLALSRNHHLHALIVIDPSSAVDEKYQTFLEPIFRDRRYTHLGCTLEQALTRSELYSRLGRGTACAYSFSLYGVQPNH